MPMNSSTNGMGEQFQSAEAIQAWLVAQFAELLNVDPNDIDVADPLDSYGLDSAQGMIIASRAEKTLRLNLAPALLWHYPTIELLAQRLSEEPESVETDLLEQADDDNLAQLLAEIEHLSPDEAQTLLQARNN
jgi:acyl carrier protein